ncbi:MAG: hypothetical protein QM768_21745 [Agriterribacter sp.]
MNPQQFKAELTKKQQELKRYVNVEFPKRAGNISLRFINDNFRAQGWQGATLQPWKENARKGTILIRKGKLRRGTKYTTSPGVTRVYNDVPYAAAHNRGFNGTVTIKAHQRRNYVGIKQATGRLTKAGKLQMRTVHGVRSISQVKAHTRKMNIPKRQFMPENITDSPVLYNAVRGEIEGTLKNIF